MITEATREKLRLVHLGKPKSEKHRRHISEGRKGIKFSEEHCKNISKGKMRSTPWNKGKSGLQVAWNKDMVGVYSEETRRKISESLQGRIGNNKGRKFSAEWCENIGKAKAGLRLTEEHKRKLGISQTGSKNGFYGKKYSPETLKKLSELKLGEKGPAWNGGSSFLPYSPEFGKRIKKYIKNRDGYSCQICGLKSALCVHHINYDKLNADENNLITLCKSCHGKTIYRREEWKVFFTEIMIKRRSYGLDRE